MRIKNFDTLAANPLRKQALLIAEAALEAIDTKQATAAAVSYNAQKAILRIQGAVYDLSKTERVVVVGFGKAAYDAVETLYTVLGSKITCGYVIDLKSGNIENLTCTVGTHPYPTVVNMTATKQIVEVAEGLTEKDMLLCVVSGGGSSLLCYPYQMSCEVQTSLVAALMRKGATIQELNTVRKHISKVKGGQLAAAAFPAQVINLVFSDVPGDDMSMVASGPTLPDKTTVHDAAEILKKYSILEFCQLPSCALQETPKDTSIFERVSSHLLVSSKQALVAMQQKAEDLGFRTVVYPQAYAGEARELAATFAQRASEGTVFLAAGESTVTVTHEGKGGRNLEMALAALRHITPNQVFVAFDSDGFDNTPYAGALVDYGTVERAKALGLDPERELVTNSSYMFFEAVGDYLDTGLTGANVADLVISIKQ